MFLNLACQTAQAVDWCGLLSTKFDTINSISSDAPVVRILGIYSITWRNTHKNKFMPTTLLKRSSQSNFVENASFLLRWRSYPKNSYQYVCMYVCMVITYSRVWINRVRLPILLVVSWTGKMNIPLSPCVPENLVSRDGFSRPVPRQPAHLHTQAESGAYLRDSSRVPRRRPFMKPPYAIGSVPSLSGRAIAYRWRSLPRVRRHRASKPQGSSERVLPWQVTMDQLIFASLSHTHYWYEVGMLKVPAV